MASDAQVEPDEVLGGGYLTYDPGNGKRWGDWVVFDDAQLRCLETSMSDISSGRQPIARLEWAMLPGALEF